MMIDSMLKPSEFLQGDPIKKPEVSTGKEVRHINKINFGESSGIFWVGLIYWFLITPEILLWEIDPVDVIYQ